MRIRTILGFPCAKFWITALCRDRVTRVAQTLALFSACCPHVALSPPFVRSSQASGLLPRLCRSWFAAQSIPYAASRNLGATPYRFMKLAYAYVTSNKERHAAPLALANSQLHSLRRSNKIAEKVCVYVRSKVCGLGTTFEVCLRNPMIDGQSEVCARKA